MGIEDSFLKTYAFGTQTEINSYLAKNDQRGTDFNIGVVVETVLSLTVYTLPGLIDVFSRIGYTALARHIDITTKQGIRQIPTSPGIVGIIREKVFDDR